MGLQAAAVEQHTIEEVRAEPASFYGRRLRLCGEVATDRTILFSDTHQCIHGRLGVKLRGYDEEGRGKCVTGRLLRVDGQVPEQVRATLITDAAVHPDHGKRGR